MNKESLDNLTLPGINFLLGIGKGTLDVLTTGLPILSGGSEIYRLGTALGQRDNLFDLSFKDCLIYSSSSLLGAAIPFAIKYHNEIYNFVEGVLK